MNRTLQSLLSLALLLATFTTACGDDRVNEDIPPTVSMLEYGPVEVPVGEETLVSGTLRFEDPDGDVELLRATLAAPGSGPGDPVESAAQRSTATEGQVSFGIPITPPQAGTYTFELSVIDTNGNESNRLQGTIEAL